MKNVTITLDDETHRLARVYAAAHGTSLSALVKAYLGTLGAPEPVIERGVREMQSAFQLPASKPATASPLAAGTQPVWTRDGKPRQPGALRRAGVLAADDLDSWPVEMLAAFEEWDEGTFDPLP